MMRTPPERVEGELPSNKYRVLLELGQGGTANVFLAVAHGPVGFNKLVVLKTLKRGLGGDPEFRRMFLNEARLSARLNHANIVQVNEVLEHEGLPVIVMEYLEGKPLSELRTRAGDKLTTAMHLRIISEVLSGLHYSHELADYNGTPLNVVHRDMTPHNVFVTYGGAVKILDFGIAKLSGSLVETQTGVIKGKLRYMPAEQITGEHVDRRSDIFAVGVMLWEAAAGSRMWGNMSEATIMNRILQGDVPSPREVKLDVDPDLERITMKALAYAPEDRYPTALELQTDLDQVLAKMTSVITARELGAFVSHHFQDTRAETQRIIDEQMSHASLLKGATGAISFPPPSATLARANYTASTQRYAVQEPRPRRFWVGLAGVGALGLALGAWSLTRPHGSEAEVPASRSAPVAPAASAAPAKKQAESFSLRITAFPANAEVFLDGNRVAANPFSGDVPADGKEHEIRAEAPGYEPKSTRVTLSENRDVVLQLEADPSKATKRRPATKPVPKTSPGTKPGVDCSTPFYVDEHGIKKFKPGCI